MTTLYRPVLIESAAQAEALPIGTVTLPPARHSGRAVATVKCDDGLWRETGEEQSFTDSEMLDEIALVPIEAEEETREHQTRVEERPESAYLQPVQQVRYKTRWETA